MEAIRRVRRNEMTKLFVIVNPVAGRKQGRRIWREIRTVFEQTHCELVLRETEFDGHARELVRHLDPDNFDGLVVVGGDGTMHEVVNGMLGRTDNVQLPIGLIPGGSGNSFLQDMGLLNPRDAAYAITSGRTRDVDVAEITTGKKTMFSISIVGWGLVTDIGQRAEKLRWLGTSRYTIASIIEVCRARPRRARLLLDKNQIVDDFVFVIACNTRYTGKGMKIAPRAKLDDGLIDVVVVRWGPGRLKMLSLISRVYDGSYVESPFVEYYSVPRFSLIPERNESLNMDGELTGSTPVEIRMMRRAIQVYELRQGATDEKSGDVKRDD